MDTEPLSFSEALAVVCVWCASAALSVGTLLAVAGWLFPEAAP